MSSNANTPLPQRPRRTWRQWTKLVRVRIGFVLMLIVAISVFTVWLPRRGVWAVVLMGGNVSDPQAAQQIRSLQARVPISVWSVIGPWIEPRTCWLATDERVNVVWSAETKSAGTAIPVKYLRRFPRLSQVELHASQVGPELEELAEIMTLTTVDIYGPQATGHFRDLNRLPYLESIEIFSDPSAGGGWKGLQQMSRLRKIVIVHPACFDALAEVGQIHSLETLVLSNGVLQDNDLGLLSDLRNLRELYCGLSSIENTVGADGLKQIARIQSLEKLNLNQCSATDDEIQVLAALHNLKRLYIGKTNLTLDGFARLNKSLPGCQKDVPPFTQRGWCGTR